MPPGVADAARAQVLVSLARWVSETDEPRAAAAIDEALGLARRAGDAATEATALQELGLLQSRSGDDAAALETLGLARSIAERAGAYEPLLYTVINESHVLEGMGEHERAADLARAGHRQRRGLRARADLGRVPGHQRGRAAGLAGPVGRGRSR